MAKPNNYEARMRVEEDYNGTWNESRLLELMDMQRVDTSWDYYDKDEQCEIRDRDGNLVGKLNW
jgi:hypothetical protein